MLRLGLEPKLKIAQKSFRANVIGSKWAAPLQQNIETQIATITIIDEIHQNFRQNFHFKLLQVSLFHRHSRQSRLCCHRPFSKLARLAPK
jgi:hypothetical protein